MRFRKSFLSRPARILCCALTAMLVHDSRIPVQAQPAGGQVVGLIRISANDEITEELLQGRSLVRYEEHMHSTHEVIPPYRLSEKVVVYLDSAPSSQPSPAPPDVHPRLNQTQMLFRPLVLPILKGTTVDFPNNDNLFHNVFSYSQPREFDLGRYPRGQSRSVRFDLPGVVKVYCDIHSYMYATILVLDNQYFTVPDDDGSYMIRGIPPGHYEISFWYGRKKISSQLITIEEGKSSRVNFEY